MNNHHKKSIISALQMFLMLISAAFNQSNAQNYFPLQLDSLQFFKGVPYTYTTLSMFPPVGSMYRVIRIDSVIQQSNQQVYYNMYTTRDTSTIMGNVCLDVLGGSWLGNKVLNGTNQSLIFFNNKNDSIFLNYNASIGASWKFYQFEDSSKIVATVSQIQPFSVFNTIDSIKKITLQFYNQQNQFSSHPLNGKEIILSKNYGAVKLPDFYFFPADTNLLERRFGMEQITDKHIYDFNIGDKYCYSSIYYDVSNPNYLYDYYVYEILNKFYSQNNQIVNYGRKVEFFDTQIVFGVGLQTIYSVSYDTISYDLNEHLPLPEEASLPFSNILETRQDSISNSLFDGITISTLANVAFPDANCMLLNNFEPGPFKDTYGVGIGLFSKDHLIWGSGYPHQLKENLVGYSKNGVQYGLITSLKDINLPHDEFFQVINIQNAKISIQYHANINGNMNIYNGQGQLITAYQNIQQGTNILQLPSLSTGIYFVEIFNQHQHGTKKVIIQ